MQTTNTVLMIEPIAFGYNAETAKNNYFQVEQKGSEVQEKALQEFTNFVEKLSNKGINVISIKDTLNPHTPDSIFPNNWVSFSENGVVTLYPMCAKNRRDERRMDIIETLKNQGFEVKEIKDLSHYEAEEKFLEGTGSIIFDHDNKLAYGSVSLRLDESIFRDFCKEIGYQPVVFHSFQSVEDKRLPIYHTNVMMAVADKFVVICLDCIDDKSEREMVIKTIENSGKEIVEISEAQMHQFAGNMLQVHNDKAEKFLVMSQSAYQSLNEKQISQIKQYSEIIYADLETIETNGGGSARCMLAEVFLPKK
ncbi:MAG: amidinotransferase [Flavobacteriales bacterium]|nr:MAG: amidinotransferase [Flavobacteriales bacterium]